MKRTLLPILVLAALLTAIGSLIPYHQVSAGLFQTPPSPSVSAFVPAPGLPLPIYATNHLAEFPPSGTIVFWRNIPMNFLSAFLLAAVLLGIARYLRRNSADEKKA